MKVRRRTRGKTDRARQAQQLRQVSYRRDSRAALPAERQEAG
jgi:hypothetical protein